MMRKIIFILSLMGFGISGVAQEAYLSREAYRNKVEAYSQLLKQQRLKAAASTEARKIAQTGFLPENRHHSRRNRQPKSPGRLEQPRRTVPPLHLSGIGNTGAASLYRRFTHCPKEDCQSRRRAGQAGRRTDARPNTLSE